MKKVLLLYSLLWSLQLLIAQNDRCFLPVNVSINGENTVLYKQSHALIIGNSDYLY